MNHIKAGAQWHGPAPGGAAHRQGDSNGNDTLFPDRRLRGPAAGSGGHGQRGGAQQRHHRPLSLRADRPRSRRRPSAVPHAHVERHPRGKHVVPELVLVSAHDRRDEHGEPAFGAVRVENAYGSGSAALAADYDASATVDALAYSGRSGTRTDLQFELSPHTRVIFSADASVSAQPQLGITYAEAGLYGELTTPFISHGTRFDASYYSFLGDEAGLLSAVANADDDAITGTLSIRTSASSESFAPPVPEPPASALLGGGLMLLAGAAWRRRRPRG